MAFLKSLRALLMRQQARKAFAVGTFIGPQNHQFQLTARVSLDPLAIAGSGLRCRHVTTRGVRGLNDRPGCFCRQVACTIAGSTGRAVSFSLAATGADVSTLANFASGSAGAADSEIGGFCGLHDRWPFSGGKVLCGACRDSGVGLPRVGRADQPIQCSEIAAQRNDDCEHVSYERRHRDTFMARTVDRQSAELQAPQQRRCAGDHRSALLRGYQ